MKGFQSFPQQDSISSLERKPQVPLSKIDQNGIKNNKKKKWIELVAFTYSYLNLRFWCR